MFILFSQAIYMRNETLKCSNLLFRKKCGEDQEKTKEMSEMNVGVLRVKLPGVHYKED